MIEWISGRRQSPNCFGDPICVVGHFQTAKAITDVQTALVSVTGWLGFHRLRKNSPNPLCVPGVGSATLSQGQEVVRRPLFIPNKPVTLHLTLNPSTTMSLQTLTGAFDSEEDLRSNKQQGPVERHEGQALGEITLNL